MFKKIKDKVYEKAIYYSPKVGLDLPYFIKGGFWLSLGQFFNMFKGFILSILLANLLSKEVYGQYNFLISVLSVALVFALPGMGPAIVQAVAKGYEGTYFKALKEIFKYSFIGSLVLIGFALYGHFTGRIYGSLIFLILAIIFPFYAISNYYTRFLHGIKRFDTETILTIIFDLAFVIIVGAVLIFSRSLLAIIITAILLQTLIQGYYTLFYTKKYIKNKKHDESSIKFGKKYSFSNIFIAIALRLDYFIIAYYLGFAELAIFAIITLIPMQFKTAFTVFTPLILPKIAKQKKIDKKATKRHLTKLILIALAVITFYTLFAPLIFKYFYPQYLKYVWLSVFFNLSFIGILHLFFLSYFIKEKQLKTIQKINIVSSIILVVLSFTLIVNFGLLGAILARMGYRIINVIVSYFYFKDLY